jgi:hypothetical protein
MGDAGTSNGLRRSPRRKKVRVEDRDDESEPESHRAVQEENEETMIKPRRLNFGLPKNSASSKVTKARAGAGNDD